jgi:predicted PurR-regulated permease PerM
LSERREPLSRVGLPTGGEGRPPDPGDRERPGEIARRAAVWGLVLLAISVLALVLWKLRLIGALLFFAVVVAAAMRPGVEALARRRVPRGVGIAVHYVALIGLFALFVWLVVPLALKQVESALGVSGLPTSAGDLSHAASTSTGVKHDILVALQKRLRHLPSASKLVRPGLQVGVKAFEVVIGVFFVFASAAYWIFERDRAVDLVCSILPRPKRKVVRDTWTLIDLKLGAFVRGQLLLIAIVAVALSVAFWAIGLPYWILIGSFAGVVDIVPVIGPLVAGVLAVGVGLTSSTQIAVEAAVAVLGMRLLEDYLIVPRVLGNAVGLTPLVVLVSITSVGVLFGGFAVILAIPLAAVAATLVDVIVRNRDPAEEEVPRILFSPSDSET